MYNKVILLGNLTRDPEMRTTPSGQLIAKFGVAMNRKFRDRDGNEKEDVTFIDVDAFGKQAEIITKYLKKGDPLHIEGRLKLETWQSPGGNNRQKISVAMEHFTFLPRQRAQPAPTSAEDDLPPF